MGLKSDPNQAVDYRSTSQADATHPFHIPYDDGYPGAVILLQGPFGIAFQFPRSTDGPPDRLAGQSVLLKHHRCAPRHSGLARVLIYDRHKNRNIKGQITVHTTGGGGGAGYGFLGSVKIHQSPWRAEALQRRDLDLCTNEQHDDTTSRSDNRTVG